MTNKRCYIDYIVGNITYAQFKQRVFMTRASVRGENFSYTTRDDLKGEIPEKYMNQKKSNQMFYSYKQQLLKDIPGGYDIGAEKKLDGLNIPCQKHCLKTLLNKNNDPYAKINKKRGAWSAPRSRQNNK